MKQFLKDKKAMLILGVLLVLGIIFRFVNLTQVPVFADEAIYLRWAQIMRAEETLRFLPLSDGKQPLYMWTVIPFFKFISDPLVAGRILSILTGLATGIFIYLSSRLLFENKKVAILAFAISMLSPFLIFFNKLALVDSMLAMFGVMTFFFTLLTAKTRRNDWAIVAGACLGAAYLTKSPALFFALGIPFSLLLFSYKGKGFKGILNAIFLIALIEIIGYAISNILRLGPNFHLIKMRNMDYVYPINHILESPFSPFVSHFKASFEYLWIMGPSALLGLFFLGIFTNLRKYWREIIFTLAFIAIPLIANSEYAKVYTARYMLYMVPFIALLAGNAIDYKNKVLNVVVNILIILFIGHSMFINLETIYAVEKVNLPRGERSGYFEEWTAGYGIKEISEFLKEERKDNPNKKIVVGTEGYFGTLPDGLQMYMSDTPEVIVIGVGLGIDRIPNPLLESFKSGNSTYLVVNNSRLLGNPEKMGMEIVAAYPKQVRPDGSRESLYLLKVKGIR